MVQDKLNYQGKKSSCSEKQEGNGRTLEESGISGRGFVNRTCYFCKKSGRLIQDCFKKKQILKMQGDKHASGCLSLGAEHTELEEVVHTQDNNGVDEACSFYSGDK